MKDAKVNMYDLLVLTKTGECILNAMTDRVLTNFISTTVAPASSEFSNNSLTTEDMELIT